MPSRPDMDQIARLKALLATDVCRRLVTQLPGLAFAFQAEGKTFSG